MMAESPAKEGHHWQRRKEERPTLRSQSTGLRVSDLAKVQPYNHNCSRRRLVRIWA